MGCGTSTENTVTRLDSTVRSRRTSGRASKCYSIDTIPDYTIQINGIQKPNSFIIDELFHGYNTEYGHWNRIDEQCLKPFVFDTFEKLSQDTTNESIILPIIFSLRLFIKYFLRFDFDTNMISFEKQTFKPGELIQFPDYTVKLIPQNCQSMHEKNEQLLVLQQKRAFRECNYFPGYSRKKVDIYCWVAETWNKFLLKQLIYKDNFYADYYSINYVKQMYTDNNAMKFLHTNHVILRIYNTTNPLVNTNKLYETEKLLAMHYQKNDYMFSDIIIRQRILLPIGSYTSKNEFHKVSKYLVYNYIPNALSINDLLEIKDNDIQYKIFAVIIDETYKTIEYRNYTLMELYKYYNNGLKCLEYIHNINLFHGNLNINNVIINSNTKDLYLTDFYNGYIVSSSGKEPIGLWSHLCNSIPFNMMQSQSQYKLAIKTLLKEISSSENLSQEKKGKIYSYLGTIADLRSFFIVMNYPLLNNNERVSEFDNTLEYLKIYYKNEYLKLKQEISVTGNGGNIVSLEHAMIWFQFKLLELIDDIEFTLVTEAVMTKEQRWNSQQNSKLSVKNLYLNINYLWNMCQQLLEPQVNITYDTMFHND